MLEIKNFQVQKQFQHVYQPNGKLTANCKLTGFHGLAKTNCKITARQAPHENQPLSFLPHMGSVSSIFINLKKKKTTTTYYTGKKYREVLLICIIFRGGGMQISSGTQVYLKNKLANYSLHVGSFHFSLLGFQSTEAYTYYHIIF